MCIKNRGFEKVEGFSPKLPVRATLYSAGYDFFALEDITITPTTKEVIHAIWGNSELVHAEVVLVQTGIKAYMLEDDFLGLQVRSSLGKVGLVMVNAPGIIDSDYNGHIHGMFINVSDKDIVIKKGEHFMQGIFQKYLLTDNDNTSTIRSGGIGSTNN